MKTPPSPAWSRSTRLGVCGRLSPALRPGWHFPLSPTARGSDLRPQLGSAWGPGRCPVRGFRGCAALAAGAASAWPDCQDPCCRAPGTREPLSFSPLCRPLQLYKSKHVDTFLLPSLGGKEILTLFRILVSGLRAENQWTSWEDQVLGRLLLEDHL